MFIYFQLVYFRHFPNYTVAFLVHFWRLPWPSALGSRLVPLSVAPAVLIRPDRDSITRKRISYNLQQNTCATSLVPETLFL